MRNTPVANVSAGHRGVLPGVADEGFEPSKAKPTELQNAGHTRSHLGERSHRSIAGRVRDEESDFGAKSCRANDLSRRLLACGRIPSGPRFLNSAPGILG